MSSLQHPMQAFDGLPIRTAVFRQVLPAVASQMITLIYNLADTYFVGMLNQPSQTAAITVVYSPFLMLTALSNLFGVGGASALARALGHQEEGKAREIAAIAFWWGAGASLVFCALFWFLAAPILQLCGATEETLPIALGYAQWTVVIGGPATILSTLLANLTRAEGKAGQASFGVSLGGVANLVLDPLFILPQFLGLGAVGAGIATCLSNVLSVVYFLLCLVRQRNESVIDLHPRHLKYSRKYLGNILAIGFPSAVQYALTVVAVAAQSRFVSQYTTEAVAALGIVKKLDQLPLYFSIGVANGLLPLLAYHYAAGHREKRRAAFRLGAGVSLAFALASVVCFEIFAPQLAALFIDDAATIHYAAGFLRRMVLAMPMMSLCYPMIIQFQAMGKVKASLVCSVLRKGVLDIPLLFLMDALLPLYGCMWVQPMVDTISLLAALGFYRRMKDV